VIFNVTKFLPGLQTITLASVMRIADSHLLQKVYSSN